jgi:enoyl-CoA hydratase
MPGTVTYTRAELVSIVEMDDGKVNVFSIPMLRSLHEAFDQAERDCTAVLLKGRPGYFSAGFDLKTLSGPHRDVVTILRLGASLAERILSFPAPVTVACTGHAFPAGAFLLMAADARVGADGPFRLGLNEVRIGLTLPWFAAVLARHRLTPAHFDHAAVTGEMFDPKTAQGAGLSTPWSRQRNSTGSRSTLPRTSARSIAPPMLRPSSVSANRSSTSYVLLLRPS